MYDGPAGETRASGPFGLVLRNRETGMHTDRIAIVRKCLDFAPAKRP